MTSVLALQSALCLPSSLVRGGMEGSVDCSEIGDRCGKEAAGAGDFAWLAAGREDGGELLDLKHTYSSSAIGKGAVDKLTDSLGLCVAPDGAGAQGFLSEALNDSHWGEDEGLTMNRTLPPNADWATFSPVNSSSSYHTAGTSRNWMQTIGESSEDDPAITGRNDTAADVSPGWQAFTLGSEPTSTSLSLSETSALAGLSLDTHNRTGVNEPHRKEPRDSCSATTPDSVRHSCVSVFRHCFTEGHSGRGGGGGGEMGPRVVATECVNDWQCLRDNSFARVLWRWSETSLHHPPPSSCQHRLTSLLGGNPSTNKSEGLPAVVAVGLSLPLGDEERFDWTPPDRRRRSLSPDVVPNLFRPRKESLVDVAFDHDRAASGLSVLSEVELQRMCDEMTSKFSRLSAELLTSLQTRDILAGEMEAKNRFVSALLRVQQLRLSLEINGGSSGEPGRGGRQWSWPQKKKDDESPYLQTVIPYKIPEGLKWRTHTLTLLTKVLKAIAEGSNTVPKLMSEYLQSEFLTSPVTDRRHSFKNSLSPDQNTVLSTLSI